MAAEMNRLFGAHFLTVPAEDAAKFVDFEYKGIAIALLILTGNELDAVGWAYRWAQAARHALGLAVLRREHAVGAAPTSGQGFLFVRILRRDLLRIEQMLGRER